MLKTKAKRKKSKKSYFSRAKILIICSLLVAIALASAAAFYVRSNRASTLAAGQVQSSDYKSLNLALARQSRYTNSAVAITKDIGKSNSVRHFIIRFKVPQDGLNEFGYMTLPASRPAGAVYPTIILCHGYAIPASYSTTRSYLSDMEFYSQQGYAVLKPDFRGQGLSRSEGQPEGAYFSMAYNTDLMNLIAAVKRTSYLNGNSISLWGHSMGAYIGLRTAVLSPDVKNLILLSLPGDIIQDARASIIAGSDETNYVAAKIRAQQLALHGQPLDSLAFWQQASPLTWLDSLTAKVQIHVASDDEIVSPVISTTLATQLAAAKKTNQLYVYTGASHGLVPQRTLIWQRSLQLLNSSH